MNEKAYFCSSSFHQHSGLLGVYMLNIWDFFNKGIDVQLFYVVVVEAKLLAVIQCHSCCTPQAKTFPLVANYIRTESRRCFIFVKSICIHHIHNN